MQQSVMNFGILMVQGLVNSFGPSVMAAFAAAVKIDSFAYMPVQDFGNAFSTFIAQNYGAKKEDRIRAGIKSAVGAAAVFCLLISTLVFLFARPLLLIFIRPEESEILSIGVGMIYRWPSDGMPRAFTGRHFLPLPGQFGRYCSLFIPDCTVPSRSPECLLCSRSFPWAHA